MHIAVDEKPHPSLAYNATPEAVSKQYLVELRKRHNLSTSKHTETKQGKVEIGIDRLLKREECVFRLGNQDDRKTKEILVQNRKKEMLENNMKKFGNVAIGIHGKELPKYHQSMAEWWKNKRGFNDNPKETSLLRLRQNMKYWAKQDKILLSDYEYELPPADDFKKTHVKQSRKNKIAENPVKINRKSKKEYTMMGGTSEKPQRNYRWTSIENQF